MISGLRYCPKGGMMGILIDQDGLEELSDFLSTEYIDEHIPLPNVDIPDQAERMRSCNCDGSPVYWETEDGGHGWCCGNCGGRFHTRCSRMCCL